MEKLKKYKYIFLIIGLFIVAFIGFNLINKDSYAADRILDTSGLPKTSFNTSYLESGSTVNYISNALNSNTICTDYCHNFSVASNYKDSSGKLPLYLLMKNMKTPKNTETFEILADNPNEITDPGLIYIINHGYNITNTSKNIFSTNAYPGSINNNIKQYITQIALWLYIYENNAKFTTTYCMPTNTENINACAFYAANSTTSIASTEVRNIITTAANVNGYNYLKYIIDLVNAAETVTSYEESSMTSMPDVSSYSVNSNGTLLSTELFTATPNGNKNNFMYYTVTVNDPNGYGAYAVDQNNSVITNKSALTGGFKVVIPILKDAGSMDLRSVSVTINGYFAANKAYDYRVTQTGGNAILQSKKQVFSNISLAYIPEDIVTTQFTFNNLVQISKKDFTNKEELPGAVLVIKKASGEKVDTWTSTKVPHYLSLENGDYSLCETTQPEGYALNTECINFTVDGTKITTVEMFNKVIIPNTNSSVSKLVYFIGFIILISGGAIIAINLTNKKLHD